MIDRERRNKLALHLRHFSVGLTTNYAFEEAISEEVADGWLPENYSRSKRAKSGHDDNVIAPLLMLCWGLYDDTRRHKLVNSDALPANALKVIARCILFLRSNREYEWPHFDTSDPLLRFSWKDVFLFLLTFGCHYQNKKEAHLIAWHAWQKTGDYDVWPFFRKSDYQEQLKLPPFLNGKQRTQT